MLLLPPLGHDSKRYAALIAQLGSTVDVHALDYPGFGGRPISLVPELAERATTETARLALLDALVADILKQLSVRDVHPDAIGGVSLGGTLCYRLRDALPRPPKQLFRIMAARRGLHLVV